jgi:hypothetical protein
MIAILIVAVPEILVASVAAFTIMSGIGLLQLGHRIRKSAIEKRGLDQWFHHADLSGYRFEKSPFFIKWYQRF